MEAVDAVEKLGEAEFKWGKKKGIGLKDKKVQFYESFTYDGVYYKLYDCIYMHKNGEDEPYIGKLIKIWEKPNQTKTVKVQWFFRPTEIWYWLRHHNQKALPNELFFASGEGTGLTNTNPLEAIAGKCNVVCISKDTRNPQPSRKQLQGADYVFQRTFDVGKCLASEIFGDRVGDLEVKFVFNKKENEKSENVKEKAASDLEGQMKEFIEPKKEKSENVKEKAASGVEGQMKEFIEPKKDIKNVKVDEDSPKAKSKRNLESTSGLDGPSKKKSNGNLTMVSNISPKEINDEKKNKSTLASPRLRDNPSLMTSSTDKSTEKKDKITDSLDLEVAPPPCEETLVEKKSAPHNNSTTFVSQASKDAVVEGRVIEVTRRPDDEEGRWFHLPPWEKRMLAASDQSMLVLLQNLDPEYTSAEVEDIIWHAFQEKCSAKVVQRNFFSSPHIGQAFLIFKSKEAAERVVKKLNDGCLVLCDQRPLVGRSVVLPKIFGKQSKFAGHLFIDKLKHQQQRDKDAVSTSHCAQPNTIEHELAMEWCLLQSRSDIWWKKLHKHHREELKRLKSGLKSK